MKTLQGAKKLGGVESCPVDIKALFLLQMMEELPSINKGEDKVKFLGRLKRELQGDDEWIVDLGKYRALS